KPIALNWWMVNGTRLVGPALAGLLLAQAPAGPPVAAPHRAARPGAARGVPLRVRFRSDPGAAAAGAGEPGEHVRHGALPGLRRQDPGRRRDDARLPDGRLRSRRPGCGAVAGVAAERARA